MLRYRINLDSHEEHDQHAGHTAAASAALAAAVPVPMQAVVYFQPVISRMVPVPVTLCWMLT